MSTDVTTIVAGVVTPLISAAGAFMGAVLTSNKKSAVLEAKLDMLKEDVTKLSEKVNEYNHLNERMVKLEVKMETLEEKLDRKE